MSQTCAQCIFFRDPDDGMGYCKRFPPTIINHKNCFHPIVDGERDWCGEFKLNRKGNTNATKE